MTKFIVTTTVQPPTEATLKYLQFKDWKLIVVGDLKTPHHLYSKLDCIYLHPDDQDSLCPELSKELGWNTIQRRNIGFVYAYRNKATIVATVDDDNIPYDNWSSSCKVNTEIEIDLWKSNCGVFDPLSVTEHKTLWHRGFPVELVPEKNNVTYLGKQKRKVLVQADFWDGDPDIDALCRLPLRPLVKFEHRNYFGSTEISPFNSQNTKLAAELLPYYMMLPTVGRMDDIWGGYLLYNYFSNFVVYGPPSVYQDRNKQDLVTNLEKEIIGYRNTYNIIQTKNLSGISNSAQRSYEIYKSCF